MDGFTSRTTGGLMVLTGSLGVLAFVTLFLFFTGLFQNLPFLASLGMVNDILNAVTAILGAVLASVLHTSLRRRAPRLSLFLLIGSWAGAAAVVFGSWLIVTGRAGVELSSYYYFYGNGLIGLWLLFLNQIARRGDVWPRNLTRWGSLAAAFMVVGLLGLYGILSGMDGSDYSPLVLTTGISYLGIGVLYPIWALRMGRWILSP